MCSVMVSVAPWSVVDRGFKLLPVQTKDYTIGYVVLLR